MNTLTYAELQALRSRAHDEARRLAYSTIDLDAVEAEIAKRDAVPAPMPPAF